MGKTWKDKRDYDGRNTSPRSRGMLIAKLLSLKMRDNQIGIEIDRAYQAQQDEEESTRDM